MWSIVKSHFHKGKTGFVITGLFVILSVMMMIIGLSICLGMSDMYFNARELSNSPDLTFYVYDKIGSEVSNRVVDAIKERGDIDNYDIQQLLWLEMPKNDSNYSFSFIFGPDNNMSKKSIGFFNIDDNNNKFKPHIRDMVEGEGFKVYVSGNYLITGHVGDKIYFKYNGEVRTGYVAGVFDDMCKIYDTNYYYVDNELYQFVQELNQTGGNITEDTVLNIKFKYKDDVESAKAQEEVGKSLINVLNIYNREHYTDENFKIISGGYTNRQVFKDSTSPFILILGAAMIAFAIIVAFIVAIVIAFLVRSSVMDEVRNLGVLKSLGYTTNMLRLSYLAIYGVICGICMIVGIILGITLMPQFVNIITNMARLDCSRAIGLNVGSVFVAISLIVFVIGGVVALATGKVKRITPLSAMRNNIETHSFKRNLAPLAKSKIPVNTALGVKSVVGETNRSLMVVSVVLIMTLLCSFVSIVFYNLKVDQTALIQMTAIENPDYVIGLRYDDTKPYYDAIRKMDGYKADMLVEINIGGYLDDGDWVRGQCFERFDILRTKMVYKGRYPQYTNEILLNEKLAKQKGYDIGDTINIRITEYSMEGVTKQCVIVGFFQSLFENCHYMAFNDLFAEFLVEERTKSYSRLFYFEKGKVPTYDDITEVLKSVKNEEYINYGGFMTGRARLGNMILNTVEQAADAVMSVFISITIIIICLLLIMLVKLKLLREKRNYAICKALGYTTPQIMTQIAVAMVILGVIGSLVGSIVGALITSPMLSAMGGMIGAGHFAFTIPWGYVAGIIFAVPLLIYAVSMLCALPVKRISPATLLRERG